MDFLTLPGEGQLGTHRVQEEALKTSGTTEGHIKIKIALSAVAENRMTVLGGLDA